MSSGETAIILLGYVYLMVGIYIAASTIPDIEDSGERFIKGSALTIGWILWPLLIKWLPKVLKKTYRLAKGGLMSIIAG